MNVAIGPALAGELPAIAALLRAARLPLAGIEACTGSTIVARQNARIVGCAALELYGDSALLRSVALDSALRGQGLGQQLTAAALDLARARGVRRVYLLTETAGQFFPRFGFQPSTRDAVDAKVQGSVEFTTACATSALVMELALA